MLTSIQKTAYVTYKTNTINYTMTNKPAGNIAKEHIIIFYKPNMLKIQLRHRQYKEGITIYYEGQKDRQI